MPQFSLRSKNRLETCHKDLQRVFFEVVKYFDCSILCGHRGKIEQNEYYHTGRSEKKFPNSKHNPYPSLAVDVGPYFKNRPHIRWKDKESWYFFIGVVFGISSQMGIHNLKSGSNWDRDDEFHDQNFFDLPHWEIVI